MKELHNHIFSNTTCISKEIMLKYINKQLSVKELHEVEKHMLDCEFCTDALEGVKYAQNSSILFAIDNQIDQRVRVGNVKTPIMRNLMVAASLLIIVFGAYFTFNYFNNTANQEMEFAINNDLPKEEAKDLEAADKNEDLSSETLKKSALENQQETVSSNSVTSVLSGENAEGLTNEKYRTVLDEVPSPMAEQEIVMEDAEEVDLVIYDEIAEVEEEIEPELANEVTVSGKLMKEEKEKDFRKNDESGSITRNTNATGNQPNIAAGASFGYADKDTDKTKTEDKKSNNKRAESNNKGNKNRYKSKSPAFKSVQDNFDGKVEESDDLANMLPGDNTVTVNSFKVVDYTDEYQKEYDLNQVVETKSISADFESQEEAAAAERERDELTVEVTYKATLEKAMAYYKSKKYTLALDEFNVILKEHPEEVNGLFYGGLSNYHLQRYDKAEGELDKVLVNPKTQFNEEAEWYKALTLIELKKSTEAKTLLQKIANGSGFYKTQASEKLKSF